MHSFKAVYSTRFRGLLNNVWELERTVGLSDICGYPKSQPQPDGHAVMRVCESTAMQNILALK